MKIITKKVYVAFDGKEFDNENDCKRYEKINEKTKKVLSVFPIIKSICEEMGGTCKGCYFFQDGCIFMGNSTPCDWVF